MKFLSRLSVLFLFLSHAILAEDIPIPEQPISDLAAEAGPSGLIAGCVDINTGGVTLQDSDIQLGGPDPLSFTRVYSRVGGQTWETGKLGVGGQTWETGKLGIALRFCLNSASNEGVRPAKLENLASSRSFPGLTPQFC